MSSKRPITDALGWLTAYGAVLISAALAARYGYKMGETEVDAWMRAIALFFIANVGCHGVAWGTRTWIKGHRAAGVFIALGSLVCFAVSLAGGLGTIASGTDHSAAERTRSIDDRDQAKNDRAALVAEKAALPTYVPTTKDVLDAAKDLVDAAVKAKTQECSPERGGRGTACRTRETEESDARKAYARATSDKATTDRAAEIDAKISKIDEEQKVAGTAGQSKDPQAATIARLAAWVGIGMTDDQAAAWYAVGVSLGMELAAMIALMAAEINAASRTEAVHGNLPPPGGILVTSGRLSAEQAAGLQKQFTERQSTPAPSAPPAAVEPVSSTVKPPTSRPRLVSPAPAPPDVPAAEPKAATIGDVEAYAKARLARAGGVKAALREVYGDYRTWCLEADQAPMAASKFVEVFNRYCDRERIKISTIGETPYCMGVRLALAS